MTFTLDQRTFFAMVKEVGRKFPGSRRDKEMRIAVTSGIVFAIGSCRAGGAVAIATEDGECVVPRQTFEDVLKTFPQESTLIVKVRKSSMTILGFTMPVISYSPTPAPPQKFDWFGLAPAMPAQHR